MLKAKHLIMISLVNFPGTLLEPVKQSTVVRHFECHQRSTWVKISYQQPFEHPHDWFIGMLSIWFSYGIHGASIQLAQNLVFIDLQCLNRR